MDENTVNAPSADSTPVIEELPADEVPEEESPQVGEDGDATGAEENASTLTNDFDDLAIVEEVELSEEERAELVKQANAYKRKGNDLYLANNPTAAEEQYTLAIDTCPKDEAIMAVYFNNRAACQLKLEQYEACVEDSSEAIRIDQEYVKAYARRATAHERLEHYEKAMEDVTKTLELDPSHVEARKASLRLPPLVEQEREKMKEEMFGKLRELGDMCLKPFGLSTNNFQMQQDPSSGSYSLNFVQNASAASSGATQS
eukprot:m.152432 g.152432  ORF g.152432 m.152432 type:complete len:258 (+) comp16356_c0_seq1:85-858(+)